MIYYHGTFKRAHFFENWLFYHRIRGHSLLLCPSVALDAAGNRFVYLHTILDGRAHRIEFPYDAFYAHRCELNIRLGLSTMGADGLSLHVHGDGLHLVGKLHYEELTPLRPRQFARYLPHFPAYRSVPSLYHPLQGELCIGDERINFGGGTGFIAHEWGRCPREVTLRIHCNNFANQRCCILLDFTRLHYLGLQLHVGYAAVYYGERQFIFSRHHGMRLQRLDPYGIELCQSNRYLRVDWQCDASLLSGASPLCGQVCGPMRFRFREGGRVIFDFDCPHVTLEFSPAFILSACADKRTK